ncbi:thioredoxin family protein [Lyngbya confervoides]|uniref:Thioredoxin family protein n=1 Tax=Lyngbya confervoides BDU141951 TaxID=1574623 RepID=A0ABD4T6N0_9CYAN|nr:thioredoxin family protein [Lyngbya confervoides]MCM1984215.1 thioredoxin family protein [Lyngbya confervoides BDU141951]
MKHTLRNFVITVTAIVLSLFLVLGLRTQSQSPSLAGLAESATPLEVAMGNQKPTLVEFYADWCTSCRAMVGDMEALRQKYGETLNFVMLNVDNSKWLPELIQYRVDGIPHFVFFDRNAAAVAAAVGEQPRFILEGNLSALVAGQPLPYVAQMGSTSEIESPQFGATQDNPRSHGAQVQKT